MPEWDYKKKLIYFYHYDTILHLSGCLCLLYNCGRVHRAPHRYLRLVDETFYVLRLVHKVREREIRRKRENLTGQPFAAAAAAAVNHFPIDPRFIDLLSYVQATF